jgi:hypothetical protein
MNIHHPTAAEQAKKARELKEKFYGKPATTNRSIVTKPVDHAPDYAEQIARLEALLSQAAQVSEVLRAQLVAAHKDHPVGTLKEKVLAIVEPILDRHGFTFDQIRKRRHQPAFIAAREETWKAAYETLPMHSVAELAEIFRVHHTTILAAARKGGWDGSQRIHKKVGKR